MDDREPTPLTRPARWWRRVATRVVPEVICWAQGHNLAGIDLPEGWSQQTCRTCGQPVWGFRRG